MLAIARKIRTIRGFSARERKLALIAIGLTAGVRVALWVAPFRWIQEWVAQVHAEAPQGSSVREISWSVQLASRYVPRATCLTQALTAQVLLNRVGKENRLHIGVSNSDRFESHAWVECGGRVVVGGVEQSARYTTILTLKGTAPKGGKTGDEII